MSNADAWRILVEALPEGAALTDACTEGMPLVYVNPAFERLTGYAADELVGRGFGVLQGDNRNQAGLRRLKDAIEAGIETRAYVQNYRKSGESFWMEVQIVPVRGAGGEITHWASLHREAEARGAVDGQSTGRFQAMATGLLHRDDPLTGLKSRASFDELLAHHFAVSQREGQALTLFIVNIDDLTGYNETFGRPGGDALLKRIARTIGLVFRRGSDLLARLEGGSFAVLTTGMSPAQMQAQAERLRDRVRDMRVHHPHSRYTRYVSVSIGVAGGIPPQDADFAALLKKAESAMQDARIQGDAVVVAPAD